MHLHHPWKTLHFMFSSISWFRFYENYGKEIIAKYRNKTQAHQGTAPTFEEFVRYLIATPVQEFDPHWAPVYLLCDPCHITYSAVTKLESLHTGYICWKCNHNSNQRHRELRKGNCDHCKIFVLLFNS